ncbi:MAG: hypothetical protein U5K00_01700 [Melioribacteraceae bacterium]|nr:hypothetical protein [Melioribacteraceae bacterium]
MKTQKIFFLITAFLLIGKTLICQTEFEWAQYYSAPNLANEAYASFVDADGNTYITGRSNDWGSPALMDMTTVKYDKDGNLLWVNRINGLCNEDDEGRDIFVDDDGYVYVCGFAGACYDFDDYAVVKYDPDGNIVWQAGYNSPPHPDMPYHDRAEKIFVDENKNVYVTGRCYQWDETNFILHWNIGTVKYDQDGNFLWADLYNTPENNDEHPVGIHVNQFGEVLVAAYTKDPTLFDQSDWIVLMYDSLGNRVWEHRFNGTMNGEDEAAVITRRSIR